MKNKIKLRNSVATAICLTGFMLFFSCNNDDAPTDNSIIGKWVTTDYNSAHNDTIHFTADKRVEDYFLFAHTALFPVSSYYYTYTLTDNNNNNNIEITSHQPEIAEFSETFEYKIDGNSLTIKGFSNPFSVSLEVRIDVNFVKVE